MEQQDEINITQDAISVLSLFPIRETPTIAPSFQDFTRLFDLLNCGLCQRTLSNPILLRCSHRFCKACIERYLRAKPLKACPKCANNHQMIRRDVRMDDNMEELINLALGQARKMPKRPDIVDEFGGKEFQLRRAESQTEIRPSFKVQNAEEVPVTSLTSLKRAKTTDHEQPKPKKKSQKKIKPTASADSEKEMTPSRRSKLAAELRDIKKEGFQVARPRKKRKDEIVIEIESSEPVEVQEIAREEFQVEENSVADPGRVELPRCSISIIPQVSEMQSTRKMPSMRDLQREESIRIQQNTQPLPAPILVNQTHNNNVESQPHQNQPEESKMDIEEEYAVEQQSEKFTSSPEVLAGLEVLQQQFGGNYLNKIIQLTEFPILMRVCLTRYPMHPFTPQTSFTQIKIIAKSSSQTIINLIASDLNINKQAVKLFVCEGDSLTFIEVNSDTKLQDINNRFWRSFGGFQILQLGDYAESIMKETMTFRARCGPTWQKRILYYTVDYSKIIY